MLRPKIGIRTSKYIPWQLEKELRQLVFDAGHVPNDDDYPQLIVGNAGSSCHGTYYVGPDGVYFVFHHNKHGPRKPCKCFVRGDPNIPTYELPQELDEYRIRLIEGKEPIRMEPLFAAMVIMKLFLGMEVPEEVRGPFREK